MPVLCTNVNGFWWFENMFVLNILYFIKYVLYSFSAFINLQNGMKNVSFSGLI